MPAANHRTRFAPLGVLRAFPERRNRRGGDEGSSGLGFWEMGVQQPPSLGDQGSGMPWLDPAAMWGWCPHGWWRGAWSQVFQPPGDRFPCVLDRSGTAGQAKPPPRSLIPPRRWPWAAARPCPLWTAKGEGGAISQGCQSYVPVGFCFFFFP